VRTISVYLSIGYSGAEREDTLEIDDDASEDQIEEMVRDWAYDYINWGWQEDKTENTK
jgi:hypothetical protein